MGISRSIRTRLAAVAAALAVTTTLAACGGGSTGSSDEGGAGKDVVIGMNSGLVPQFQRYAKAYEKAEPGVKVTVKPVPDAQADYIQQLVTQGLSKSLPDIVFNYDSLNQTLASSKLLYDLKPWLDSGKDGLKGSAFLPNYLGQYRTGGEITGIPVSADAGILYFNKSVLEKYGITETPDASWTYEKMLDVAGQVTRASGGKVYGIQTPVADGSGLYRYYPVLKSYGSDLYDAKSKKFVFADPKGIEAWKVIMKGYTDDIGTPFAPKENPDLFTSGQVAMIIDTRPNLARYRESMKQFDWDVAPVPQSNGEPATGGGSYSLSIAKGSGNKEGAYKFMAWFYSTDGGMKVAAADGVIPATKEGLATGAWLDDKNPVPASLVETTKYAVKNAVLPPPIPDAVQPKLVPALQEAIQKVALKDEPIEKAFGEAQGSLNAELK